MPGFNVNNFRANGLIYGGARPTQFAVLMTFPPIIDNPEAISRVPFLVKATQLPSSNIDAIEVPYFGRKIKVAGDRVFDNWAITVMNDEDFAIRNAFEQWHNGINAIISNTLDPAIADITGEVGGSYKTDAIVTQFSKVGLDGPAGADFDGDQARKTYKFNGVFPISVEPINVSWEDTNQIEQFDVVLAYDWYEPQIRGNDTPMFPIER